MNKKEIPSMDQWLQEAKQDPSAEKIGMYLVHNGIVRKTSRKKVRLGDLNAPDVNTIDFSYDAALVEQAVQETYEMPGIYYIRTWLNSGSLEVGEDIMYVLVGGDIRPHVVDALQSLVEKIKTKCVKEIEK